ncbi:hypothetical protein [uncultured Bacteroides sp.]|uniref:hypothetical protein n=1 Tax=uncultured Bacteroides sp. TaxID=162156 RepID=UPI00262AE86F|nr:hypothetical protein [uncultured Bacteroides sp.]
MKPYLSSIDISTLSTKERILLQKRHALHRKYEEAVNLYIDTDMTQKAIAEKCKVSLAGLGNYLRRYWREQVLIRHQISVDDVEPDKVKIIAAGTQSIKAHAKYKEAIAACDSLTYIDFNISQIARKFGLNGTALANYMRIHYPDTLIWREKVRHKLGINDNVHHGVRPECALQYAEAVEMYRESNMTIPEIAELCKVSERGFSQHMRFYHKDVLKQKKEERQKAQQKKSKNVGDLMGNGRICRPTSESEEKYKKALSLYKDTSLTMKEIVSQTGVSAEAFRFYVHKWHKDLVYERLGISGEIDENTDLRKARKKMKTVAAKYEKAIESLRLNPRPVTKVAEEYGFNPEVFRDYLHKHEPELAKKQGKRMTENGKYISLRAEEKYAQAIELYNTTTESLKSIAKRLNIKYNSLGGFVRRNRPDVIINHNNLLKYSE